MNDRDYSRLNLLCCALFLLIGGSATVRASAGQN